MTLDDGVKIAAISFYLVAIGAFAHMMARQWYWDKKHHQAILKTESEFKNALKHLGFTEITPPPDLKVIKPENETIN